MSFRYLAEARLYQYLGEYDAFVQLEEVAIRRFVTAITESPSPRDFVIGEARARGINVTVIPTNAFLLHAAQTNIVVTYQSVDQFLNEFQVEHEFLHQRKWPPRADRDSIFDHLIRSLGFPLSDVERALRKLAIEVFDYYRLVRNLATHRYDPHDDDHWGRTHAVSGRERDRVDAKHKRIYERFAEQLPAFRGRLSAPNAYEELTFDDFILATRNIKHLASALSTLTRPDDHQLLAALRPAALRFHRKEPHNISRVRRRIAGEARSRFGIDKDEADSIASLWLEPSAG